MLYTSLWNPLHCMIGTPATPPKLDTGFFCSAVIALLSVLAAAFACFRVVFAVARERSLFHNFSVTSGIVLLLAGATYGASEPLRRFRRRPPHVALSLGAVFVAAVLLSGSILIVNGLLARRHSAPTRNIEELKVIEDAIDRYQREKSAYEGTAPDKRPSR